MYLLKWHGEGQLPYTPLVKRTLHTDAVVRRCEAWLAKRLLETRTHPIDEISSRVGYVDTSFFRRLFKRLTGLTPAEYRRMFQPIALAAKPA